jgi:hypothetical protein
MSRVRHVYAKRGEYIKVHRPSGDGGVGCFGIIILIGFLCMLGSC